MINGVVGIVVEVRVRAGIIVRGITCFQGVRLVYPKHAQPRQRMMGKGCPKDWKHDCQLSELNE